MEMASLLSLLRGLVQVLVVVALAGACGTTTQPFSPQDAQTLPDDQVSILDWSGWGSPSVLEIDGEEPLVDGKYSRKARLRPGTHTIRYGGWFSVSILYGRTGVSYDKSATIEMKPGHVYAVKRERIRGRYNFADFLWIEDQTTGALVAGLPPPGSHREETARRRTEIVALDEAAKHFETLVKAAACGDATAQYDLAHYYLAGLEPAGQPDILQAYLWYSVAASNGHADAARVKKRIATSLTTEQASPAERILSELQTEACPKQPTERLEGQQAPPAGAGASP